MNDPTRSHLLMVPYYFPPLGMGGVQRPLKFARYLPEFGWDVSVLTPSVGAYHAIDDSLLAGLPESVKIVRVRTWDPARWISTLRSWTTTSDEAGEWRRNLKSVQEWLRWPDDKRAFVGPAVRQAMRIAAQHPVDLVWTTSPPPSTHLVGMRLRRRLGVRWVADFRDPWFARFDDWGPTRWHARYARQLCSQIVRTADGVIAASQAIGSSLARRTGGGDSPTVICNGFDESDFAGITPAMNANAAFTIVLYGTFGINPDPKPLFALLREWKKHRPGAALRVRHVGLSLGRDLQTLAAQHGLAGEFESLGYQTHRQSIEILLSADLAALPLSPQPGFHDILPGRIFELLRSRRPILLLTSAESEATRLLQPLEGCWTVAHEDFGAGIAALDGIARLPREAPARSVSSIRQFERREQTRVLAGVLDRLKTAGPPVGAR